MAMTPQRRGEIAYATLGTQLRKSGLRTMEAGKVYEAVEEALLEPESKKIKLTREEGVEFIKGLAKEVFKNFMSELE